MRQISLIATANQEITCTLDEVRYVIRVVALSGVMGVSISADGVQLVTSSQMLAGEMLIPYEYREAGGNFLLQTLNGDLPDWQQFGTTQQLFYFSAAELEAIRG
jgi:hypothetical protein